MLMCGGLVALALKTINSQEDGVAGFFSSMVKNDLWVSIASTEVGGWYLTGAAWCILSGIVFYTYWGISYMAWVDPGVYVVTIALIASGMGMKRLSGLEEED
jgi:high-affinity Fe2+/Pb2+ permease